MSIPIHTRLESKKKHAIPFNSKWWYFIVEGFKEAALKFQQEAGLQEPALCSSLDERIMIREAVQNGRIPEAIAMVNALHPELLDNDRYLYFHLQVCYE